MKVGEIIMYVINITRSIKDLIYESDSDYNTDDMLEILTYPFCKKYCARTRLEFSRYRYYNKNVTLERKLSSYYGNINILSKNGLFMRENTISNYIDKSHKGLINIAKGDYMTVDGYTEKDSSKKFLIKYKKHKIYERIIK